MDHAFVKDKMVADVEKGNIQCGGKAAAGNIPEGAQWYPPRNKGDVKEVDSAKD
jgi:hypothetical protein